MSTKAELSKLKKLINLVPKDRLVIAQALFDELVFISRTLNSLRDTVDREGPTAMFSNGKQQFLREHPALKSYSTVIQRYSLLYKQLTGLLPAAEEKPKTDALMDFIKE